MTGPVGQPNIAGNTMPNILFAAGPALWADYREALPAALADIGIDARICTQTAQPDQIDYIIYAAGSTLTDFTPYTKCKAVLNLWAGVERFVANPTLTQPLARMVNQDLTECMVQYVVGHTLRQHLGMQTYRQDGIWRNHIQPPLARDRPVSVLGAGALGTACALALAGLHFPVTVWGRRAQQVPGLICRHGPEGLDHALASAQVLVALLPLTPETTNLLNARRLAQLPRGACIINPGRGALIEDAALIAALDTGQVAHATLAVFRTEPLPADHPYWAHPGVTVTPHIAADTRPASASQVLAENIRRGEAGEPLLHLVDRARGY